jgi:(p)ppGpp synthase/HD superfamily hydrolase
MKVTAALLEKAILFATEKHSGQVRKRNGMPYIMHPIAVMTILNEIKKSNNDLLIAIACLLHDVVEDCGVTLQEIAELFGHRVASLVEELTSDEEEIARVGKKEYLAHKMLTMSSYALRIKLADRLHNLSDFDTNRDFNKMIETVYILDTLKKRHLTSTHRKLIKAIKKKIYGRNGKKRVPAS